MHHRKKNKSNLVKGMILFLISDCLDTEDCWRQTPQQPFLVVKHLNFSFTADRITADMCFFLFCAVQG